MAHDVFISYSSSDKPIADAACAVLEQHGIRCWIAPRDILAGMDWSGAIIDAIGECRAMVLIFSAKSNESEQVKREVATVVGESKPIVPFRLEAVSLSKHMRYFISTPHWLDALQPPLEQHLERLAETVGLLLGIELNKRSVELMEVQSAPRGFSFDTRDSAKGELCGKEAYGTDAHNPFEADRLSLQITSGPQVRNVCLLARRKVHLGKHRHNDIVLRVLPPSNENDLLSNQLSRHHAALSIENGTVIWQNLNCQNGTLVEGQLIDAEVELSLHHGEAICPAGVVSMACDIYVDDILPDPSPYQRFAERIGLPATIEPAGTIGAVRLRRTDNLSGLEQYIVFARAIYIGRDATCPVLLSDSSVASKHALIINLGGALWLEPVQREVPTLINGNHLRLGQITALRPGTTIQLGEAKVSVGVYKQYYIDFDT